ncbi:hypothetical protein TNCV_2135981 [Trichonephila clavipes]|nr:hypothetical protein TNCV_2135981 [Trichonephila clavipes]
MKEGLIASSYECPKCNEQMRLKERKSVVLDGFEWRCRKKATQKACSTITSLSIYGGALSRSLTQRRDFPEFFKSSCYTLPSTWEGSTIRKCCADSNYADSTCAYSRCSITCADSSVTSPTATYADFSRTYADSTCIRTCADSSVTSLTVTCAESPRTHADSLRARHFGPFGVDRCILPAHVVRIWTPRTPAASHGTLYF